MKKIYFATAMVALLSTAPVSAQLLGGGLGGSLGGGLGGTLGGTLGGSVERTTGTIGGVTSTTGSVRGEKSVNRRTGKAKASGSANGSSTSALDGVAGPLSGNANGSASGSANGNAEADLIGTDAIGSTVHGVAGHAHDTVGTVRNTAGGVSVPATGSGSASGNASGNAAGNFLGNAGQLAAVGSTAASGAGMFSVVPGMDVEDAKGHVVGQVVGTGQTAHGVVKSVVVQVGDRVATLPAASFAGSGDVLVTGMTKGDLKSAAKDQDSSTPNE